MAVAAGLISGGSVWTVPLIWMVAERRGLRVRRTRRIDSPVRSCTVRERATAVNTIVRCASIASRVRANSGRGTRRRWRWNRRRAFAEAHSVRT